MKLFAALKGLWPAARNRPASGGSARENHRQESADAAVARELRRMLDNCPICDSGFGGHFYALFATTVMDKQAQEGSRTFEFLKTLKEHRWREALRFQDWEDSRDDAEAYAVRCHTGRLGLLLVSSPHDPQSSDTVVHFEVLDVANGEELTALISPDRWEQLQPRSHSR